MTLNPPYPGTAPAAPQTVQQLLDSLLAKVVRTDVEQNLSEGQIAQAKANLGAPKVYRALLTQSGTADPVATIIENTLGAAIVWSRFIAGIYTGMLVGAFPQDKTWLNNNIAQTSSGFINASGEGATLTRLSDDTVQVATGSLSTPSDSQLLRTPIEILVFP